MRMCRHYTPEEIQFIKKNIKGRSYAGTTKLFNERFNLQINLNQMKALLYKHNLHNGMGTRNGCSPQSGSGKYRPVGSEREESGYIKVKVSNKKYGRKNWKNKQVVIWEAANGKVPKGHVVLFADRNKRNFALDNLLLVSKAEFGVMNSLGLISPHKELTKTGKAVADLKMAITNRKRKIKKPRRSV